MISDFSTQPEQIPGQPIDSLYNMLERNRWAGGNILRGELPVYPTIAALPTATADYRYRTVIVAGAAGVADLIYVCLKTAADAYSWRLVTTT